MKLYSNPKNSADYIRRLRYELHKDQIERDSKFLKKLLLDAGVMIAIFTILAVIWSVLGN